MLKPFPRIQMPSEETQSDRPGRHAEAIARTPGDVLWTALFGFPPSDSIFRDIDGSDPARTVAKLLAVAGSDGFPIIGQTGERCWRLPPRLDGAEVAEASAVMVRALDMVAADEIAERHRNDDDRNTFEIAGHGPIVEVTDEALTLCLRTLLELPSWWQAPKAPLVLANRPSDDHWRIAVSGMDLDLLGWRAKKAVEETIEAGGDDPLWLLDTPYGRGFQAALGPAPYGYARRIRMASRDPYFIRSASSWLAVAARDAFSALRTSYPDTRRWQWSGVRRGGLAAACMRLSGDGLGALAERVAIAGPFEPNGASATMSFQRVAHGGVQDPLAAFMTAALAGEMT
jgi:hypothetical protein